MSSTRDEPYHDPKSQSPPRVHIIRHGQSLHNIQRDYPHRDPPLTETGHETTKQIRLPTSNPPDLLLISPMTRTIQTAMNAFPSLFTPNSSPNPSTSQTEIQIWPSLRESHDATCNKGLPRASLSTKYPTLDFASCPETWNHEPPTTSSAVARAESVRQRLKQLSGKYRGIAIVTHRGFIAFLVQGARFDVCERRTYRFGTEEEMGMEALRWGVNVDSRERQDFGPTGLVEWSEGDGVGS